MINVLVSSNIPDELIPKIQNVSPEIKLLRPDNIEKQPELLGQVEIMFGNVDSTYWEHAGKLNWYQSTHAGVVNTLKNPNVKAHQAVFTNIHIHPIPMAEHVMGMMIMLTRNIDIAYQQQLEKTWSRKHIRDGIGVLHGKTLGVMGLGAVGNRVIEVGQALGMKVIGLKRTPEKRKYPVYTPDQKHQFLEQCDYIVVVLPGTDETHHMIGPDEFALMKPSTYLFNIGRGGAIDTDALIAALKTGQIAGAGLDVVDPEPLPVGSELWTLPKVIITPHSSADSLTYMQDATEVFIDNLKLYLAGKPLMNVVDKDRGY